MPSFARSLFLATPALLLVLISSLPITPTYAVASPFPTSIPLESTGYSVHSIHNASSSKTKVTQSSDHTSKKHSAADHLASMHTTTSNQSNGLKYMRRLLGRRSDADRMSNQMHQLRHHVDSMNASARSMRNMAEQSSKQAAFNRAYQQNVAAESSNFYSSAQSFNSLLKELAAYKGLASYDPSNPLEVILKDFIDANKDFLTSVDVIVANMPVIGPLLGPVVYDLKCLVDVVLNIVENTTDAILNALAPLLGGLLGHSSSTLCASGIKLLGLCLL